MSLRFGTSVLQRVGILAAVGLLAFGLTWVMVPYKFDRFDERRVDIAEVPQLVRDEVFGLGGGRCVEQFASVYLCTSVQPNQGNEGPRQREWCYDSDGEQVLEGYPAKRGLGIGPWKCRAG